MSDKIEEYTDAADDIIETAQKALGLVPSLLFAYSVGVQVEPRTFPGFLGFVTNPANATPASQTTTTILNTVQTVVNSISGDLGAVDSSIANQVQQNLSALSGFVRTASSDVQAAYQTIQNWQSAANSDVQAAFQTLFSWAAHL